jgi:hypothetical protein
MVALLHAVLFLLPMTCLSSCIHDCNEAGCQDGFTVVIDAPGGTWRDGMYTLAIDVSGQTYSCDFEVPNLAPPGAGDDIACEPPADVWIMATAVSYPATRAPDAASDACSTVPDRYTLSATFQQTPTSVSLVLSHDGAQLLNTTRELAYRTVRPNGPGCEPVCRRTDVKLALPE